MKGFRERSVDTHLIAMKAAGQPKIFMFTNNIWIHIFYTCAKPGVCQISNKSPINTPP